MQGVDSEVFDEFGREDDVDGVRRDGEFVAFDVALTDVEALSVDDGGDPTRVDIDARDVASRPVEQVRELTGCGADFENPVVRGRHVRDAGEEFGEVLFLVVEVRVRPPVDVRVLGVGQPAERREAFLGHLVPADRAGYVSPYRIPTVAPGRERYLFVNRTLVRDTDCTQMKAVVLAAGTGERFLPLTATRPKSMLPVANKPLLEHVVESLVEAGVDELVVVIGSEGNRIQRYFEDGGPWNVDVQYAIQESPLGTGDALLQAEPLVGNDFLVLNGDRIVDPTLLHHLIDRRAATGDACMAVTRVDDPSLYGVVSLDDDRVTNIVEKPPEHAVTSNRVNAGAYAFGSEIFSVLRETEYYGELDLTKALRDHLDDHPVRAVHYDGTFFELTRPWDLLTANEAMLDRVGSSVVSTADVHPDTSVGDPVALGRGVSLSPGARVLRGSVLGEDVDVEANAVITNSVVLEDTTVGAGTVLRDCIVGSDVHLGPNVTVQGGSGDVQVRETVFSGVKFGGLIGDGATVGGSVVVEPGTIVGNDATIDGGVRLFESIPSGSMVKHG